MPDISHLWGNDLTTSATGDLAVVDGPDLTTQRIIRRLMTAVEGYIWHLSYGAGVPQRIGDTLDTDIITGIVTDQVLKEATVARDPAPVITVKAILNGVFVSVVYSSSITGQQITLSFDVNN